MHALSPLATCEACARACPRDAVALGEAGPDIRLAACDGCGLCAAACPTGALGPGPALALGREAGGLAAFAACERAGVAPGPGRIACLHALAERDLARLWRRGVRRLRVSAGDCTACPRGAAEPLAVRDAALARLAADRGLEPIAVEALTAAAWIRRRDRAGATVGGGPARSRRGLLALARAAGAEGTDERRPAAAGALLPAAADDGLAVRAPRLDPSRCEACDACARLCPEGAIALRADDPGGPAYVLDGHRCTGCGLCRDVCAAEAVRLEGWARPARGRLPLAGGRCRTCGAPFRTPATRPPGDGRCPICLRTGRGRRLREVDP